MGAIPYDGGVTFRVWAPHATAVAVAGTFNDWSDDAAPAGAREADGYWSADVAGVAAGDEYQFRARPATDGRCRASTPTPAQ